MTVSRSLSDDLLDARRTREQFEDLLANPERIGPDFEPVRDPRDDRLVGLKASARGWAGTEFADRAGVARVARALGLVERVDWTYICRAFDVAFAARASVPVHITPEPESLATLCPPRLAVAFNRGKRELDVVMELRLELFDDDQLLHRSVEEFRSWGWRIAIPDVAEDSKYMATLLAVRPEIVHVDLARPGRTPAAPSAAARRLLELAGEFGSELLATGVDTPRQRDDAVELGATSGRGRLFGGPGPLSDGHLLDA